MQGGGAAAADLLRPARLQQRGRRRRGVHRAAGDRRLRALRLCRRALRLLRRHHLARLSGTARDRSRLGPPCRRRSRGKRTRSRASSSTSSATCPRGGGSRPARPITTAARGCASSASTTSRAPCSRRSTGSSCGRSRATTSAAASAERSASSIPPSRTRSSRRRPRRSSGPAPSCCSPATSAA